MATVVDDLVTRYRLDYKDYKDGADQVVSASKRAAKAFDETKSQLAGVWHGAKMVGLAVAAAAAGITAFAYSAMKAAAEFDTFERVFGAALGSMEAGKQTMAALESYATKSAFSLEALAEAAKTLAAGGMDIGRFLPIVERFALVISGVDPRGLQEVAGALLRSKGGGTGEAMEIFRRAGIGTPDLIAQGIKVDKGGQIQSSAKEFLDAIDRIAQGRVKTMADAVSGGAENTLSNVGDVIGQAVRNVGKVLNDRFLPLFQGFTDKMKELVDAGVFGAITDGFLEMSGIFSAGDINNSLDEFAIELIAAPGAIRLFGQSLMAVVAAMSLGTGGILDIISRMVNGKSFGEAASDTYGRTEAKIRLDSMKDASKRMAEMRKRHGGADGIMFPKAPGSDDPSPAANTAVDYLKQIADNTQRQVNLMRGALGGGDIGAMGIGQADLSGMKRSGGAGRDGGRLIAIGMGMISHQAAGAGRSRRMAN